jgi:hypothetical protein
MLQITAVEYFNIRFADIVYLSKIYYSTIHLSMTFRVESICFRRTDRISVPMIYLHPEGFLCFSLKLSVLL